MKQDRIPSVSDLPPRAGLTALRGLRHGLGGILPLLEDIRDELGNIFQLSLGKFNPVFVSDPSMIRWTLTEGSTNFSWRPVNDPVTRLLGRGVLVTDGDEHDRLRSVMNPSAKKTSFIPQEDIIWRETDTVLNSLPRDQKRLLLDDMRIIALRIFWRVFAGEDLSPHLKKIWAPMLAALEYISPGLWVVTGKTPEPPQRAHLLHDFLLDRIRVRREKPTGGNLLDDLIQAGLSDQTIQDQMLTMLIAGHDTSTAMMAWTLVCLEQHPKWKTQLQDEIRSKLGDDPPRDESTCSLPILNAVIKETLRLYPPIHVGNRLTTDNITIGGYPLPAGQRVMLSIYLVHRHPQYWQDAKKFQPERWLGEFRPASFSYIPFGGGPRNCIGGQFAQVEARIVLARILQKLDFHVEGRILPWMNATLEPHSPYWKVENI